MSEKLRSTTIKETVVDNPRQYYKAHGPMTAPGTEDFAALPGDIAGLCKILQGVLIHRDLAGFAYGLALSDERRDEAHIRPIAGMLREIFALDQRPLTVARELDRRMACVCRHFTVGLCAMLREQGVPARARCGFGAYFNPGKFEDHWVCEYWNAARSRWILVDAQLDAVQRNLLKPDFDPLDVPRDRFIVAGDAWRMCRTEGIDPALFGLSYANLQGLWFIAGNIVRDLASLNRMELLPWDVWGLMPSNDTSLTDEHRQVFDRVAALTMGGDDDFLKVRAVYASDDRLRAPKMVFNVLRNARESIIS
ncbi:MAG: transglutaminase domain-containing protein [Candidatus Binataceae bacterium]